MVDNGLTFSKIFEVEAYSKDKGCPAGFKPISKRDNGRGATCLKLKVRGGLVCYLLWSCCTFAHLPSPLPIMIAHPP